MKSCLSGSNMAARLSGEALIIQTVLFIAQSSFLNIFTSTHCDCAAFYIPTLYVLTLDWCQTNVRVMMMFNQVKPLPKSTLRYKST